LVFISSPDFRTVILAYPPENHQALSSRGAGRTALIFPFEFCDLFIKDLSSVSKEVGRADTATSPPWV
jgi:hypothetical protein